MIAVIWIDWYPYHRARMQALVEHSSLAGRVEGIELVGGIGVHQGLRFREETAIELPVTTLLPNSDWKQAGQIKLARLLCRKLHQLNPSVLLVPGYYTVPALAAAVWGKLHGRCTVLMTESTESDYARSPLKENLKGRLVRGLFDWAIAGGKPHVRYLARLGFPPGRIARFYDVVDNLHFRRTTEDVRAAERSASYGLPEQYFLFVGRLAAEKNIDGLIRAFARYRRFGGSWSLVIAGDGPLSADLQTLARQEGVSEAIQFRGLQTYATLPPFYAFAGCFVLPSSREPWGLVVNEAMAAGLPVIVSSRCGCAEDLLENGVNGFGFDPISIESLCDRLTQMSAASPAQRAVMGRESLFRIEQYSPAHWASEVARIEGEWIESRSVANRVSEPREVAQ